MGLQLYFCCVHPLPLIYMVWVGEGYVEGQSDFQLLSLEVPALVSEGHPTSLSSLPGREMQVGRKWRGQIWGGTSILRSLPSYSPLIEDRGLVPTGLREAVL